MTAAFTKIVRMGTMPTGGGLRFSIFAKIEWSGERLSITGVEGPNSSGGCIGSCGQIVMGLGEPGGMKGYIPAPGWSLALAKRFLALWDRWHLNDMCAGSPAQREWLRANPLPRGAADHYGQSCAALADAGLNPDPELLRDGKPYRYGTAWLREEVPADVLAQLQALPDTDRQPAWV